MSNFVYTGVIGLAILSPFSAFAADAPIKWRNEQVTGEIVPGGKLNVTNYIRSNQNIIGLTVNVDSIPAGLKVVAKPSIINKLVRNEEKLISFDITAADKIASESTLKVTANVSNSAQKVTFSLKLVAADDVGGPDIDGNGIRDDVDDYIRKNFQPGSEQKSVSQSAKALQKFLLNSNRSEVARESFVEQVRAGECLNGVFGFDKSVEIENKLQSLTLNTKVRARAYFKADEKLAGIYVRGQVGDDYSSSCSQ